MFTSKDFQNYRKLIGFTNQETFKQFLKGKDISPTIDFNYITALNNRLVDIFTKFNYVYYFRYDEHKLKLFFDKVLFEVYETMKINNIIQVLNNQGRRREEVYFSWMRGYLAGEFFKQFIASIWDVSEKQIKKIGDDDFSSLESFTRSGKPDFEIPGLCRLEIQSGFQGINDIKQHKVLDAKTRFRQDNIETYGIHFDLFNGQVACINLSKIEDNDLNWITRPQMEGQVVFNINQGYFLWRITEKPTPMDQTALF